MKTQLLEDIGQSAALPLTSSNTAGNPPAGKAVPALASPGRAQPARPRSAIGVWRQKPAGEPVVSPVQQPEQSPEQPPAALDLHEVFEEIAALEAQFVPPDPQQEPAMVPAEPLHVLPTPPAAPVQSALPPAAATLPPDRAHTAAGPQDPVFDFTPPPPVAPAAHTADPFTPAGATGFKQRHVLWAACLLALAMLIGGGRWWYQGRADAAPPAPGAAQATQATQATHATQAIQAPRVENTVKQDALAARESTAPGDEVRVKPAELAIPPSPGVPPLVMLAPDPPAATIEQPAPAVTHPVQRPKARKPAPVAKQTPPAPLAKRPARVARAQPDAPAKPAREKARREPARQLARASAIDTEKPSRPDTTTAALLRACREHGYHAAQCIKRGCSVTDYGFACRGR